MPPYDLDNFELAVRTHLDLSTGHITRKDDEILNSWDNLLEECPCSGLIVDQRPFGYIVHVPEELLGKDRKVFIKQLKECGFSDAFISLLKVAAQIKSCDFINFDADGQELLFVPTFEW